MDWVEAGLRQLLRRGPEALRIQRLCDELKVTKGSFYHHFTDVTEFHYALLDHWRLELDASAAAGLRGSNRPLQDLADNVARRDLHTYDVAVRNWAATNPLAAKAVRKQDRFRLQRMKELYLAQGFDDTEADARAQIFQWAWIGSARAGRARREAILRVLFDLLTEPAPETSTRDSGPD